MSHKQETLSEIRMFVRAGVQKVRFCKHFPEIILTPRSAKSSFLPACPLLERLAEKCEGQYKVLKMTIDKHPMISHHDRVQGVPALMTCVKGDA